MGEIGLSQEKIIQMLTERGINSGELQSASKLREAIANVITENNLEIEKKIHEISLRELASELKRYTAKRY
jgi:hypothetical protein